MTTAKNPAKPWAPCLPASKKPKAGLTAAPSGMTTATRTSSAPSPTPATASPTSSTSAACPPVAPTSSTKARESTTAAKPAFNRPANPALAGARPLHHRRRPRPLQTQRLLLRHGPRRRRRRRRLPTTSSAPKTSLAPTSPASFWIEGTTKINGPHQGGWSRYRRQLRQGHRRLVHPLPGNPPLQPHPAHHNQSNG